MVQRSDEGIDECVISPAFDANGTLADSRKAYCKGEDLGKPVVQAESFYSGGGEDNGVVLTFVQLSQSGIKVSPELFNVQIRPHTEQLTGSSQTARPYLRPPGQVVKSTD